MLDCEVKNFNSGNVVCGILLEAWKLYFSLVCEFAVNIEQTYPFIKNILAIWRVVEIPLEWLVITVNYFL